MTSLALIHGLGFLTESQLEDLVKEVTRDTKKYNDEDLEALIEVMEGVNSSWGPMDEWTDAIKAIQKHRDER